VKVVPVPARMLKLSTQATLQAWGAVAGKLHGGKGSWAVGRHSAEHEPAVCRPTAS